ncbi:hypothetical protein ACQ4PT_020561 [Festuca glaucescens]
MAAFCSHPPDLELLSLLRLWVRHGERKPWIHDASVYSSDPVSLSGQYLPATADNGEEAWYFICAPSKKPGIDERKSRLAGSGTWKEERGRGLFVIRDGLREKVGWRQSFTYMLKSKGHKDIRLGWIMLEIQLQDGDERCLCKVYRSPHPMQANPLLPNLALAPAAAPAVPEAPPAPAAPEPEAPEPEAPEPEAPASEAPASEAPAPEAPAPEAPAPAAPAPEAPAPEAPTKWVKVEISNSPTKFSDRSSAKRVFQVLDLPDEDQVPNKRMRGLSCRGWLTLEAVPSQQLS